nr:TatD family hydrolase [uncultured Romboutsia sp.]
MYIDFHNHIDFYKDKEIDSVINCINLNKIKIIACSMDEESYLKNIEISKKSDYIVPIFGIHPWRVKNNIDVDKFEYYIKNTPLIGEIGLDFHWIEDKDTYPHQIKVFEFFLQSAKKYDKYINIHTKGCEELILNLLKKYDISSQSIIHWYSGDKDTLKKLIDAKCYFTGSVDLGYIKHSKDIIKEIPANKLLAETDGPTALQWVNGTYGMPDEIKNVYKNICEIKNLDIEEYKYNAQIIMTNIINNK